MADLPSTTWTIRDMAQLRGMVRTGTPARIAALRLGRTEISVRSKLRELNGQRAPDDVSGAYKGTSALSRI
jgi:hypothetical protein